jgi:hypothetical protein
MSDYPYITTDNRENRQFYMYSKYSGINFLEHYNRIRSGAQERLTHKLREADADATAYEEVLKAFEDLANESEQLIVKELFEMIQLKDFGKLDKLVHSFEIRKRVYATYDQFCKPATKDYRNTQPYIALAFALSINNISETEHLRYLNALLKLNDTILSFEDELSHVEALLFKYTLQEEQQAIRNIMLQKGLIS